MDKVYAIHEGCRFEGGGVTEIYADKEKAIKFALMKVEQERIQTAQIHADEPEEWEWKEIKFTYPESKVVKLWQNPIDEIIVYEYDLIN